MNFIRRGNINVLFYLLIFFTSSLVLIGYFIIFFLLSSTHLRFTTIFIVLLSVSFFSPLSMSVCSIFKLLLL